jgi:hypothetical protein
LQRDFACDCFSLQLLRLDRRVLATPLCARSAGEQAMIELGASHFKELCAHETVRERLGALEGERRAALRQFWKRGAIGLVLSAAALYTLFATGWHTTAIPVALLMLFATVIVAALPLMEAGEALKHPVLEELARRCGMEYLAEGFDPPAYGGARRLLFGSSLSSETFTDLFHGADEEGRGFAVYEACLQRRVGKNTVTVFSGLLFAIQRRPGLEGISVAIPDRKILNFFKPASDMERVRIEEDEPFEKRFEIYATVPAEARSLFSPLLRARLLEMRGKGRIFVYVSPDEVLLAAWDTSNRFEPGSMFRSRPGEERVKGMFDEVAASLTTLRALKQMLG